MTRDALRRIQAFATFADRWNGMAPRERVFVGALAIVAVAVVLWVTVWQPLVRDVTGLRAARAQDMVALAEARRVAAETAALAKLPPPVAPRDARADLDRVLAQHGLRGAAGQLAWQEGRAHVVFGGVGYEALINMLDAVQRDARLRVIEARLTARVEPGTVRAEVTLGP